MNIWNVNPTGGMIPLALLLIGILAFIGLTAPEESDPQRAQTSGPRALLVAVLLSATVLVVLATCVSVVMGVQ